MWGVGGSEWGLGAGGWDCVGREEPRQQRGGMGKGRHACLAVSAGWVRKMPFCTHSHHLLCGSPHTPSNPTQPHPPYTIQALSACAYVRALLIALRLGDTKLLQHGLLSVPLAQVGPTAKQLPALFLQQLLSTLVELLESSPHMEFMLAWAKALLVAHGPVLAAAAGGATALRAAVVVGGSTAADAAAAAAGGGVVSTLRALQQVVGRLHQDISSTAEGNVYMLNYLVEAGKLQQQQHKQKQQQDGQQQMEEEQVVDEKSAPQQAAGKHKEKQRDGKKQHQQHRKQKSKQKL